ncbi:MAG: excinuclease ABC subunit UvrA, partial [bacterium]
MESLSAYARQFLGQMEKPDVDSIDGLSPSISIDQRVSSRNPRSTVGTVTEIADYMRLLFAHIGKPHCYKCGKEIVRQTAPQITDQILEKFKGSRVQLLAPVIRGRKGEYKDLFAEIRRDGFVRARIDGKIYELDEGSPKLDKKKKHTIEIVIDRLEIKPEIRKRLAESVETALKYGKGNITISSEKGSFNYSELFACADCGISMDEITPRIFSFNSPYGACPACGGLGDKLEFDADLIIPDKDLSILEGAIVPWNSAATYYMQKLSAVGEHFGFDLNTPIRKFNKTQLNAVLYGTGDADIRFKYHMASNNGYWEHTGTFEGVIKNLRRRYTETQSENVRYALYRYMSSIPCDVCKGERLRPESLAVTIGKKSIAQVSRLTARGFLEYLDGLKLTERDMQIAKLVLKEIRARLKFMVDVGLDYITIDREAWTLSGGESQRIRLATQIGSGLVGVLYILDEPSIGLHQKDNQRLIQTLKRLRDLGNTLIVVEHDEETMRSADYLVDIGPGAGVAGGHIIATGEVADIVRCPKSITGKYLSRKEKIDVPASRRKSNGKVITIKGARHNNLQNIDVTFPLGVFTVVTGISGSGKSSLINDVLYRALAKKFYRSIEKAGEHDKILGLENIDKVIIIDQSPIGRTPRSNPATYTGVFDHIRNLFAETQEAKIRGYLPGRFSFNVKGGRC